MPELDLEQSLRERLDPETEDGPCGKLLYGYASSEATREQRQRFEEHLEHCAECQADLAAFKRSESPKSSRRFWTRRWPGVTVLAAAAAAAVAMLVWPDSLPVSPPSTSLTPKGAGRIHLAVRRGDREFVARSGDRLEAGDQLGLFYTATEETWLVILFADDRGEVTTLYPSGKPQILPPAKQGALPSGAVVEQGSGCEWFVGFFSPNPRPVAELNQSLQRAVKHRRNCTLNLRLEGVRVDVLEIER